VTLRARWVTLSARWVTLRARWVTLSARWVTFTAAFPFFGRLRRDTSVEPLKGRTPLPPIQLPIEMSKMADQVATVAEAALAVRDAVSLCCLLDNHADR
jgi:hypothetical protein